MNSMTLNLFKTYLLFVYVKCQTENGDENLLLNVSLFICDSDEPHLIETFWEIN